MPPARRTLQGNHYILSVIPGQLNKNYHKNRSLQTSDPQEGFPANGRAARNKNKTTIFKILQPIQPYSSPGPPWAFEMKKNPSPQ